MPGEWASAADPEVQTRIWREMLANHAENLWSIGTVSGALQPIIARNGLKNIPRKAVYSWEPTSMLGVYRMDEFFWDRTPGREVRRPAPDVTGSLVGRPDTAIR